MNFGFSILNSILLFLINHRLLGLPSFQILWVHELIRAAVNTLVALPIFMLLDHTKRLD
jgi:rod shape-determining protein MreD